LTSQVSALALNTCSLPDLAAAARRVAPRSATTPTSALGGARYFLAAVHAAFGGEDAVNLEAFKRRMVSAHRAGLVVLVRADMVAAMPGATVAARVRSAGSCASRDRLVSGLPLRNSDSSGANWRSGYCRSRAP